MKTEFMVALTQLSAEKHLPKEVVLSAVESALVSAYKKDCFAPTQDILAKINPNTGEVRVYVRKIVAETPDNPLTEISLSEAQKINRNAQVGESLDLEATPPNAGRIAAQTARQVILQRLHEAEHHAVYEEFSGREGDIITGTVQRITPEQIYVDLGKTEAILPNTEQVRNERYRPGQRLKVYIEEVTKTSRGPQIIVSRTHRNLLRRLFELEIPEIYGGTVDIKGIAREPSYRSKVAVAARQEGVDPVGCCVGLRGIRIQNVVNELNGEKIDVIAWSDDPAVFIANALSPAQVSSVHLNQAEATALVAVPDRQLSLAIGKDGQNARLAAKLTGWRIDIKSVSVVEAEKATTVKETAEAEEAAAPGEEEIAAEAAAVEEALSQPAAELEPLAELEGVTGPGQAEGAEEPSGEEEQPSEVAPAGLELVFAAETKTSGQAVEPSQIRFAEEILPSRSLRTRGKKTKKESETPEGKAKAAKKGRGKRVSYPVDEEMDAEY